MASAAGDVNLATALVLRKLLGDTHAAALLKTLEGGSKSESSVKAMLWKRAKEVEKFKLSQFTTASVNAALSGHWNTPVKSALVRVKGKKRPVSELTDAERAAVPGT